jgi:hypothetical protein
LRAPVANFETTEKTVSVAGSVSDLQAKVSLKLNDNFLSNLAVATVSGDFQKNVDLQPGANKISISAVATTGAMASVDISGTYIAKNSGTKIWMYLVLFLLTLPAIYGILRSVRHLRSKPLSNTL